LNRDLKVSELYESKQLAIVFKTFESMTEPLLYPYSIKNSIATVLMMVVLMTLIFSNIAAINSVMIWIVYGISTVVFLLLITLLIIKRLIPALKGDIALEVSNEGIVDYIRNVSIAWDDIKEISLIRGRSASTMRVDLKWESDYGNQIAIPLRWVKGKDTEIFNTVLACFERGESE